ncbi:hypothetical protein PBOI14_25320 [Pseudomonas sp. Boi14]|nr:hypothetical protein PBOI14_25320 [Pseudomonas sp. Boi14]
MPTPQLPMIALQEAWDEELQELAQAPNPEQAYYRSGRAAGMISALLLAELIDLPTFDALEVRRLQARDSAVQRIKAAQA